MEAPTGHDQNADQIAYWNGAGGLRWAQRQPVQDILLQPIADLIIERAKIRSGERVLDVGCGSGSTTFAFAKAVGASGHVMGIDISAPMLAVAREVTPPGSPVEFALADATIHPFVPESFDLLASRFGVMFFADPALSFANLRKAMRRTGRLAFACWREARSNPFFMVPLQAVYQHVPKMPQVGPEEPGPFAFASEERVKRILGAAGFSEVAMEPVDLALDVAIGGGLEAAVRSATEIGPAARALTDHPPETVAAATQAIREALRPLVKGQTVLLDAAIWIVTAKV
ncbi:class I SAM-dependent methyltransferase [Bradyrhizobium erythrophlei]|jgi:ubiquinone/menaquinone biosynthesis C-methylase UbiE|uniref:Ubiquinone/menaquinone biosynthesis C-methylase UbiE n=1 Tax=Bradyrhizobium erythrophlei TaxID=1437360 RepID=A0A1M7USB4_9BRAD|nr:methyltransferase domain-containing protein [Bradyrhizobium erythrophlei]SHN85849.1 Ubiquinone/menaquinone biosynthesis C-methylase UbiE [Bradyrhizobium erythrophlei]